MAETASTLRFGEKVDSALTKSKNTRRWLMKEMLAYDIDLTDTQLSNRCTGYIDFKEDEMAAITKIFKKHKIEFHNA